MMSMGMAICKDFKGKGKMDKGMGKGKAKGGGKGEWACEECGFSNKASNEVCGGTGPIGCKAPKPMLQSDWVCDCGFINKPRNDVCGGANGSLGCKAPRPDTQSLSDLLM